MACFLPYLEVEIQCSLAVLSYGNIFRLFLITSIAQIKIVVIFSINSQADPVDPKGERRVNRANLGAPMPLPCPEKFSKSIIRVPSNVMLFCFGLPFYYFAVILSIHQICFITSNYFVQRLCRLLPQGIVTIAHVVFCAEGARPLPDAFSPC